MNFQRYSLKTHWQCWPGILVGDLNFSHLLQFQSLSYSLPYSRLPTMTCLSSLHFLPITYTDPGGTPTFSPSRGFLNPYYSTPIPMCQLPIPRNKLYSGYTWQDLRISPYQETHNHQSLFRTREGNGNQGMEQTPPKT